MREVRNKTWRKGLILFDRAKQDREKAAPREVELLGSDESDSF